MDDPAQALAYASADFEDVNRRFVERFAATFPDLAGTDIVDLGCGPADITERIARTLPNCRVVGVDGALEMLRLGLGARLVAGRVPSLPFRDHAFGAVVSNSLFHHLPNPDVAWLEIRRLGRTGAAVFVMDLFRPSTREDARRIVDDSAPNEPEILRRDFYNSLLAAFLPEEVEEQLARAGLSSCFCEIVSERHWLVRGRLI